MIEVVLAVQLDRNFMAFPNPYTSSYTNRSFLLSALSFTQDSSNESRTRAHLSYDAHTVFILTSPALHVIGRLYARLGQCYYSKSLFSSVNDKNKIDNL